VLIGLWLSGCSSDHTAASGLQVARPSALQRRRAVFVSAGQQCRPDGKSPNPMRGATLLDSAALSGDTLVESAMHDNGRPTAYVFR
jgi:hypothetical protein